MEKLIKKILAERRRKLRIRKNLQGTADRPRLSVHVSNLHITAQIIDDSTSKTLVYATTVGKKAKGSMTEKAEAVGTEIATKAKQAKVKKVVFDRSGRKYHGRIKKLAEAARKAGLEF